MTGNRCAWALADLKMKMDRLKDRLDPVTHRWKERQKDKHEDSQNGGLTEMYRQIVARYA